MVGMGVCIIEALLVLSLAIAPTFGQLNELLGHLRPLESKINKNLLTTQVGGQSEVYTFKDLLLAIPVAADGIAGLKFYVGEAGREGGYEYGLVNLAAFLAQSMKETIQYDVRFGLLFVGHFFRLARFLTLWLSPQACDENNWDMVGQQYPVSCGGSAKVYLHYI